MKETSEQMMKDSDMIFTQISSGNFDDFKMAEQAVCLLYAADRSVSRSGMSHALGRLQKFYHERDSK